MTFKIYLNLVRDAHSKTPYDAKTLELFQNHPVCEEIHKKKRTTAKMFDFEPWHWPWPDMGETFAENADHLNNVILKLLLLFIGYKEIGENMFYHELPPLKEPIETCVLQITLLC